MTGFFKNPGDALISAVQPGWEGAEWPGLQSSFVSRPVPFECSRLLLFQV